MPINPEAVGLKGEPSTTTWTSKDSILYALGVGAGHDELAFTTENSIGIDQRALPTQVVTLVGVSDVFAKIGSFNPAMLVHGEQRIELASELPVSGSVETIAEITAIYDKGKGAVVELTFTSKDTETGNLVFTNVMSAFIRGEGGWGGDRGPSGPRNEAPDRAPDHEVTYQTSEDQALLYRLSGDRNPLHSDPQFAALAGFDRPILHGLCTYGFSGRALLHTLCDGDPARFGGMEGRFSSPVFPGEALTVSMWVDGEGGFFKTSGSDGRIVFDSGRFTLR
ncbi:MAG: MaoC family dehydratase N-terminal domain-containing protein [Microthrixaceae bacterium]|nr:MaoC family dehydratase N-terminal domain-containing protein [Microthrixaceae bacterium]